jgi:hypothetical protein
MPRFHAVPAKGDVQSVHFVFPMKLKEPRYLRAVEVLPGNRRVVLQVNALFDRSGRARELAGAAGWYERFGSAGFFPAARVPAYIPGRSARRLEADAPLTLTPDMDLVLQVRYRPRGEPEMDLTRIGLFFTNDLPKRFSATVFLGNEDLKVAGGTAEEIVRDRVTLPVGIEARDIRPNLLRFGRGVRAWAEPPGEKRIPLLEIDDWDFTWQDTYAFAKPIALPKGTIVTAEWGVANPGPGELRAGDGPQEESPSLWIGGVVASSADHIALNGANLRHYTELMNAARRAR